MINYICDSCDKPMLVAYGLVIEGSLDWKKKQLCQKCADELHVLISVFLETAVGRSADEGLTETPNDQEPGGADTNNE